MSFCIAVFVRMALATGEVWLKVEMLAKHQVHVVRVFQQWELSSALRTVGSCANFGKAIE